MSSFSFKGRDYLLVSDIISELEGSSSLQDSLELLDAYCGKFSTGKFNLSYFLECDPYRYVFSKHHSLSVEIKTRKDNLRSLERSVAEDFNVFMEKYMNKSGEA